MPSLEYSRNGTSVQGHPGRRKEMNVQGKRSFQKRKMRPKKEGTEGGQGKTEATWRKLNRYGNRDEKKNCFRRRPLWN